MSISPPVTRNDVRFSVKPGARPFAYGLAELAAYAAAHDGQYIKDNLCALYHPERNDMSLFKETPDPELWRFAWTLLAGSHTRGQGLKYQSEGVRAVLRALSVQMEMSLEDWRAPSTKMVEPDENWQEPPSYTDV